MENLIQQIEDFLSEHQISERQFGELAMNDSHFVRQLREGRDLRMSTLERICRFMTEYRGKPTAPVNQGAAA